MGGYDYDWPRLQPETIARKARGDSPLLETGALRASMQYSVDANGSMAVVGTNDPDALFQELGTVHIPPRSFLLGAALHKLDEVHKICGHDMLYQVFNRHHDPGGEE